MSLLVHTYNADSTVAVSGNLDLEVPGNPNHVSITLGKVSGGNVTALSIRRSLDGGTNWGPSRTVTLAASLTSAGDAVDIDLVDELVTYVRLELTVSASTVVHIGLRAEKR